MLWYLGSSPCNLFSSGKPDRLALLAGPVSRRSSSLSRLPRLPSITPLGPASHSPSLLSRAENTGSLSPLEGRPSSRREWPDSTKWGRLSHCPPLALTLCRWALCQPGRPKGCGWLVMVPDSQLLCPPVVLGKTIQPCLQKVNSALI